MSLIAFLLLVITFPYWFPVVAFPTLVIATLWMIGYPLACTAHMLYVRVMHGRWVHWHLLYPGQ